MDSPTMFLSVQEAARRLRISTMSLYRRIQANEFPAIRIGGRYAIEARLIDAMAADAERTHSVVNAADYVA